MRPSSLALNAAIRAIQGESDITSIVHAFGDHRLSLVIACAPDAVPLVRAIAALRSNLPALLDATDVADPKIHDAVLQLIETDAGSRILASWADIVPAGRGRSQSAALVDAARNRRCSSGVAAALIGPCDASAALLDDVREIAFAVRRWGQSTPDAPAAWMDELSAETRNRIITAVQRYPFTAPSCLPWLPPKATHTLSRYTDCIGEALSAFAEASPVARAQHAALLQRLVAHAQLSHLGALTRLACATKDERVWKRIHTLVQERPSAISRIVDAAPWEHVPGSVRNAIVDRRPDIRAARGQLHRMEFSRDDIMEFFAALDPMVWDMLDCSVQRRLRQALREDYAYLAVRSPGLRTAFLAQAEMRNDLVHAALRRFCA